LASFKSFGILNKMRMLSLGTVQNTHRAWRLLASIIVQPYHLEDEARAAQITAASKKVSV